MQYRQHRDTAFRVVVGANGHEVGLQRPFPLEPVQMTRHLDVSVGCARKGQAVKPDPPRSRAEDSWAPYCQLIRYRKWIDLSDHPRHRQFGTRIDTNLARLQLWNVLVEKENDHLFHPSAAPQKQRNIEDHPRTAIRLVMLVPRSQRRNIRSALYHKCLWGAPGTDS